MSGGVAIESSSPAPARRAGRGASDRPQLRVRLPSSTAAGLFAATALAGGLRLWSLRGSSLDPFYDAAVRSMGESWHNFFFGAFDSAAATSIDKPAVSLWPQVASVKLLGFDTVALLLPQALAGTLAVPLLGDLVRRLLGARAGVLAALALAVLPLSVVTARSDTMDSAMMLLLVAAAWLAVRAGERDSLVLATAAGVAIGLAFNFKLFEALLPAPVVGVLLWRAWPVPARRRALGIALASAALLVVGLSWATAASVVPTAHRPYPIGSTDGTVWNAIFDFNGVDRVGSRPPPVLAGHTPRRRHHAPLATPRHRVHRVRVAKSPATGPGPLRLLDPTGSGYGLLIGCELLAALLLGALALAARGPPGRGAGSGGRGAGALALALWLLIGVAAFSAMARLHPRYLEAFSPAVAAALGAGIAGLWGLGRRPRLAPLLGGVAVALGAYAVVLSGANRAVGLAALGAAGTLGAVALGALALGGRRVAGRLRRALPALAAACALVVPATAAVVMVGRHRSDSGQLGTINPRVTARLDSFLDAHAEGFPYQAVAASAIDISPLIARDDRPVLFLTSYRGRPLTSVATLRRAVGDDQVGYAFMGRRCGALHPTAGAGCVPADAWVVAHGVDVSRAAGLRRRQLYRLDAVD